MMRIKFIGTGTMGSTTRANTSILIDNILLDCGMGTVKQMERLGEATKNVKCLLITHFHADHFFDIPNLLIGRRIRKECNEKLYIIVPQKGRRKVIDMMKFSFGDGDDNAYENIEKKYNIEFIEMYSNETYNIGEYEITLIELKHGNCTPACGYLLEKEAKIIGYTGDTRMDPNLLKMCEKADYMLVDTTTYNSVDESQHLSFEEVKTLAEKYIHCKFFSVHRGDYVIPANGKVVVPNDGDEMMI